MQALENERTDNPVIVSLIEKISEICTNGDLVFCWLPGHIGIDGNKEADKAAKEALSLDVLSFKVSFSDFKPLINVFIHDVWQRTWCDPLNKKNKLFAVKLALASGFRDFGPSTYWSYIFNALLPPQRRRCTSMCIL